MSDRAAEFFASIKPFTPLWRSLRVNLLATKRNDTWLTIAARFTLSPVAPMSTRLYIRFDQFFAIDADVGIETLNDIIASVEEKGCLPPMRLARGKMTPACYT